MNARPVFAVALLAACFSHAPRAAAREDQFLMPEQSAAKAKQVLAQAIEALGGSAYLNVRDATCTGHISQFDTQGELSEYVELNDIRQFPDKARIEYIGKGRHTILQYLGGIDGLEFSHGGIIISLFNGDRGWTYDRSGVSELPAESISEFQEEMKRNTDNLLRYHLKDPNMVFRYGGTDVVDLKQAEWVELVDSEDRTIRIAFELATHLPIRKTVEIRDPKTRRKSQEVDVYSNYHPVGGIQTPLQVTRERNSIKVSQVFFEKCDLNTNLPDALFTRESLDQRWAQSPDKNKYKDKKDKGDRDRN
ncbi:MAG: hypothetical protein LAN36_15005 [Acidobacteriia bacterium]|nr:hypothetical protein [Terriglobia bacterium]